MFPVVKGDSLSCLSEQVFTSTFSAVFRANFVLTLVLRLSLLTVLVKLKGKKINVADLI